MLPLEYPVRWIIAGTILLSGVLAFALAPALLPWQGAQGPSWLQLSDKWLHGITFAFLSVWYSGQLDKRSYWKIVFGLIVFGGIIEYLQSKLSYRTAEFGDFYADIGGIVAGLTLALAGVGGWSLRAENWMRKKFG